MGRVYRNLAKGVACMSNCLRIGREVGKSSYIQLAVDS